VELHENDIGFMKSHTSPASGRGAASQIDKRNFGHVVSYRGLVKNPSPEGPALVCPQRGPGLKPREYWRVGVLEKAFPGI